MIVLPMYTTILVVGGHPLLDTLSRTGCFWELAIQTGVRWSSNRLDWHFSPSEWWWWIFLVLVALCLSGLGQCLFRSFAHFSIGLHVCCALGLHLVSGWSFWNQSMTWLWQTDQVPVGWAWKVFKGSSFVSSCDYPCAFSLKRSPEPASFSYHVSLFCSLPLYMVGRSDIKQGWLNKGWYIDIKNALTEIPLCSLGQRSVIVTGVALVTSVAWKPLMGTQVTHDSGWVQEVRKKEGLRERGKKRKKVKQDFIVWMKDQELGN